MILIWKPIRWSSGWKQFKQNLGKLSSQEVSSSSSIVNKNRKIISDKSGDQLAKSCSDVFENCVTNMCLVTKK